MDPFSRLHCAIVDDRIDRFISAWDPDVANTEWSDPGMCLLHILMTFPRFEFVEFMLQNGADPNIRSKNWSYTPLMYGVALSDTERTRCHLLLLKYGGNPYLSDKNNGNAYWQAEGYNVYLDYFESYLMVDLVCGEADNLPLDIWRVVKPFIYKV